MDKRAQSLRYEGLELSESLNFILDQDFWLLDHITPATFSMMESPIKFTTTTSIYVRRGHCKAEINLRLQEIEAPCIVTIASSHIMEPLEMSDDFEAAFVVMSENLLTHMKALINDDELITKFRNHPVLHIPTKYVQDFELFFKLLADIIGEKSNKFQEKAVLYSILAFFFTIGRKCQERKTDTNTPRGHITENFLKLAQENFKKERFLEFYANRLQITTKHLSRTLKAETGYTAGEWLDRLVLLEAKVLLRSSNMNIQQIADELNFPSQSFFGKYFKNKVGISPKNFRNL